MRVICVKWGKKYGKEWVYRLRDMVSRNLEFDSFVCMTDKPIEGVDCVECEPGLPTWWSKVGLFKPGKFAGDNLYLDLDVVVTSRLDGLVDAFLTEPDKLWSRDDFSYSLLNHKPGIGSEMRRLLGGDGTINSSVMLWRDDAGRRVWDDFRPEKMDEVHGDQNWITQALWPDGIRLLPPELVCSYKYHIQRGASPSPVVVFHGNPKVTELSRKDPLRILWES